MTKCDFIRNDGGRAEAGYRGHTGDCGVRAIAIALELPYQQVYDEINEAAQRERRSKKRPRRSSARTGIWPATFRRFMEAKGWQFKATMGIGTGCRVHLRADELPSGRIICNVSRHYVAVIDGVIHDTHDCSRDGTRCVYGYYYKPEGAA